MTGPFEIPRTWAWATLGEIADVVGGVTKDSKRQSDPSFVEVPYLRVANVQRGYLNLENVATIRVSEQKAHDLQLRQGDVLLNEGGDRDKLGRGWIWEGQLPVCIHQNHVFRARIHGEILHPKLLAWHANGFGRQWFQRHGMQSVNLASISLSKIRDFPIPIPPLAEQRRMVAALDDHFSRLGAADSSLSVCDRRGSALTRATLGMASAGADGEHVQFGEVIAEARGGWSRNRDHLVAPGTGVGYLKMNNISALGDLVLHSVVSVEADAEEVKRYGVADGDLLFNNKNSAELVGKAAIADSRVAGFVFNENITRIRLVPAVLPRFAALQINSPRFRRRLTSIRSATTSVAAIYTRDLRTLDFWVPPLATQEAVVRRCDETLSLSQRMQHAVKSARSRSAVLIESLLRQAFAGRLLPQDPSDEPASELLARIRAARAVVPPRQREVRRGRTRKDKPAPPTRAIGRDYQQGELPL